MFVMNISHGVCMQIVSVGFRLLLWVEFVKANEL